MAENGTPTKRINCNKTDFATKERMLGLTASVKGPALAATGGREVAQLLPPCPGVKFKIVKNLISVSTPKFWGWLGFSTIFLIS